MGVSFPAPLWAEALARVATEMFEDICSDKTFEGLREFAPRELAAVERCARSGCGRAVRQALIWGVVGALVVVQLGVNVNVSRKFPGDAMPSRLLVFVLALVGFVLGAVASVAYTCRSTNLLCRICRNAKVTPHEVESKDVKIEPEPGTEYIFVDYNAWEYAGSDELWTGLIRNIYEQVEKRIECGPHKPCELRIVSITVGGQTYTGNLTRYVKNISTGTDLATVLNTIFNTATTGNVTFAFDVNTLRMIATHNANSAMTFGGNLFEDMLHFPVNKTVASPTASSQAIDVHYPISKPVLQAGSERNLKRAWRVKSAVRLLKKEYGVAGLRARVLLLLAVAAGVVAVVVCEAVGASHLLDALVRARRDAASAARVIAGGVAALAAAVSSARLATRSSRSTGSRGSAIFEEAKSVKDQLGFMSKCKEELNELFRFLRYLRDTYSSSSSRSSTIWTGAWAVAT